MDSSASGQRKRKSPKTNNIFEVNEDDLSTENSDPEEPEPKVKKTDHLYVCGQKVNSKQNKSNLQNEQKIDNVSEESYANNTDGDKISENIIEEVSVLEEGEVSELDMQLKPNIASQDSYITILFKDKEVADIYRKPFLKFLHNFVELQIEDSANTVIKLSRTTNVNPSDWVIIDNSLDLTQEVDEELAKELPATPQPVKKKKKKKKKKDLFVLDTTPGLEDDDNQTKYRTRFLINEAEKTDEQTPKKPMPSTCFNCSENHNMKDCPVPKNYSIINFNRQKLANKNKNCRYHLEGDQKYGHLCPGKISMNLQRALGLNRNQIPKFFYKMREWGYPPGWLEEAKIVKSDLAMFDIHGNHVKNIHARNIKGLDPEKVIDYPGFNIPLEEHIKDESRHHHMPPYSSDFSKERMIEFYETQCMGEEDNFETQDMDLSNTNETEIEEIIEVIDLELQSKEVLAIKDSLSDAPSPSLKELEKEKETLLEQLIDTDEISNSTASQDEQVTIQTEAGEKPKQSNEVETGENPVKVTVSNEIVEIDLTKTEEEDCICTTPISKPDSNISLSTVKTSTFGTPILKSSSPYCTLPNPDNFSKDVSPVINFENLPNSTGKYEQMTGVLQKVRTMLKGLNQCKS